MTSENVTSRLGKLLLFTLLGFVLSTTPSTAQYRTTSTLVPGEPVPKDQIASAGAAGRALSASLGVRPVVVAFWRPGDAQSEQAVSLTARARAQGAIDVAVLAPAVLAAGQRGTAVNGRLSSIGLTAPEAPADNGTLSRLFGVSRVPSIALIDASGVLRLVGASSILQDAGEGISVLDAAAQAGRGEEVPTLGALSSRPVYRLLGQKLPQIAVTEPDGKTWRKVNDYVEPGKKLMVFYWAPDCPHCREELPKVCSWYDSANKDEIVLVDVARTNTPGNRSAWTDLVAGCPSTHLLDPNRLAGRSLLVTETPTAFLLDGDGEVLSIQVGGGVEWGRWAGSGAAGSDSSAGVTAGSAP